MGRVAMSSPQTERELSYLSAKHERGRPISAPTLAEDEVVLQELSGFDCFPVPWEYLGPRAKNDIVAGGGDLDVLALVPPGAVAPPHDPGRDGERPVACRDRDGGGDLRVVAVSDRLDQLRGVHRRRVAGGSDG